MLCSKAMHKLMYQIQNTHPKGNTGFLLCNILYNGYFSNKIIIKVIITYRINICFFYFHTWELFRLMNSALKLYAFLSDLILTRCWQIPPTPSGLGFPLHDRPNTRSSNTRLVNSTPKQKPSKLYLWYKKCNIISNSLIAFGNSFTLAYLGSWCIFT